MYVCTSVCVFRPRRRRAGQPRARGCAAVGDATAAIITSRLLTINARLSVHKAWLSAARFLLSLIISIS